IDQPHSRPNSPFCATFAKNRCVQSRSFPFGPEPTNDSGTLYPGTHAENRRGVVVGREPAAAAPGLVADAPITHVQRLPLSILRALIRQRSGPRGRVAILHPPVEILRARPAQIGREIRLRAGRLAEPRELNRAELVRIEALRARAPRVLGPLRRACPEVRPLGALVARSDSVAPVVTVGKAAARPADHGWTDAPQRFDQRLPQAANVRNRRILAYPNAVVNHTAQILDEMPVDPRRNRRDRLVNQSLDQAIARGGS